MSDFAADRRGNVAVLFAIAAIPMLSFVGAAVDYARASNARAAMQMALDSAALMLAKEAATTRDITARGQAVFNSLYQNADVKNVSVTTTYTKQNAQTPSKIEMSGKGSIDTAFLQIIGISKMQIGSSSTASWANTRLRVALALDNTGSMDDYNKIGNLRSAAKQFVTKLREGVIVAEDLYVSVVPFTKVVNIGSTTSDTYLDWSYWEANSNNQTCDRWGNCSAKPHSNWIGCVTDRQESYDVNAAAPTSAATRFSPDTYVSYDPKQYRNIDACTKLQQMLKMSNDFDTINSTIDAMTAFGGTNQPIGLFWSWWTLRQTEPYKDIYPRDPNYQYITAIVLFTDGVNTQSRRYGNGQTQSTQIDSRQRLLCSAIKADTSFDGTKPLIYTVQVDTDGSGQQQVLKDCASDPTKYFFMTDPKLIVSAFTDIAASLSRLRITQ